MTVIPASRAIVKVEDATVDLLAFDHAAAVLGDARAAGKLMGYVEAVLAANPGLAAQVILPLGREILLPEFRPSATATTRRLWDE